MQAYVSTVLLLFLGCRICLYRLHCSITPPTGSFTMIMLCDVLPSLNFTVDGMAFAATALADMLAT